MKSVMIGQVRKVCKRSKIKNKMQRDTGCKITWVNSLNNRK